MLSKDEKAIRSIVEKSIGRPIFFARISNHKWNVVGRYKDGRGDRETTIISVNLQKVKQGSGKWNEIRQYMVDSVKAAQIIAHNWREHIIRSNDIASDIRAEKIARSLEPVKAPCESTMRIRAKDTVDYRGLAEPPVVETSSTVVKNTWAQYSFSFSRFSTGLSLIEELADNCGVHLFEKSCAGYAVQGNPDSVVRFEEAVFKSNAKIWGGKREIITLYPKLTVAQARKWLKETTFDKEYEIIGKKRVYIRKKRGSRVTPIFSIEHLDSLEWADQKFGSMKDVSRAIDQIDKTVKDAMEYGNIKIEADEIDSFYQMHFTL